MRLLAKGRLIGAFVVTHRISGGLNAEGSGRVLNVTMSEPYQAGVSQALSLPNRTVARPSQLRLCHKPRGPVLGPQIVSHYVTSFVSGPSTVGLSSRRSVSRSSSVSWSRVRLMS